MDCKDAVYKISCEIANVAEAIGEPTDADWLMVWIAGIAAFLSLVLACVAVWNGALALSIARRSDKQLSDVERSRTARALIGAIVALDRYENSKTENPATGEQFNAQEQANEAKQAAIVEIAISSEVHNPEEMTDWFLDVYERLRECAKKSKPNSTEFRHVRGGAISEVQSWKARRVKTLSPPKQDQA